MLENNETVLDKLLTYFVSFQNCLNMDHGSDVEIADCTVRILKKVLQKPVYTEAQIYYFNGQYFQVLEPNDIRLLVLDFDGFNYGTEKSPKIINLTKSKVDSIVHEAKTKIYQKNFFNDSSDFLGINCSNGFLQFNHDGNCELKPHSPEYKCRYVLSVPYEVSISDEEFKNSLLNKLLTGCFLGDDEASIKGDILAEILGCAALNYGTKLLEPVAVILLGEKAGNGKSRFLELSRHFLPTEAVSDISITKFHDERYTYLLAGKCLNVHDEFDDSKVVGSNVFKQLITGDDVTTKPIYKAPFTFKPTAQHVFSTNKMPKFKGGIDRGIQRRLMVINFNRVIPVKERILNIGAKIAKNEAHIVLKWAILGASRVIKNGLYSELPSSELAIQEWLTDMDPVHAWLDEVVVTDDKKVLPVKREDAYQNFRSWASHQGFNKYELPTIKMWSKVIRSSKYENIWRKLNNGIHLINIDPGLTK